MCLKSFTVLGLYKNTVIHLVAHMILCFTACCHKVL